MSFFASEDFFFNFNEKNRGAKLNYCNVLEAALAVFSADFSRQVNMISNCFLKQIIQKLFILYV